MVRVARRAPEGLSEGVLRAKAQAERSGLVADAQVVVRGQQEVLRAFSGVEKDTKREMRKQLKQVAEPVRRLAEELAVGHISNIGSHWSRMRLGVTARAVYIAPTSKRAGGSPRPNLSPLLLAEMESALDQRSPDVLADFDRWVAAIGNRHGF